MRVTVRQSYTFSFNAPGVGPNPKDEYRAFEKIQRACAEAEEKVLSAAREAGVKLEPDGDGHIVEGPECLIDWTL
jgi:hypothetical protein